MTVSYQRAVKQIEDAERRRKQRSAEIIGKFLANVVVSGVLFGASYGLTESLWLGVFTWAGISLASIYLDGITINFRRKP